MTQAVGGNSVAFMMNSHCSAFPGNRTGTLRPTSRLSLAQSSSEKRTRSPSAVSMT
jgi:hypothetical protein